jgi:hypothetical protein
MFPFWLSLSSQYKVSEGGLKRCGSPQEARQRLERCGAGGGLVLGASNTVSFDVPVENIAAWYEAVRDNNLNA